jgi:hypothetical protein
MPNKLPYKFTLLSVCYPDYFQGYGGNCPLLSIPVDQDTDREEIINSTIDYWYASDDNPGHPVDDTMIAAMCMEFILHDKPFGATLEKASEGESIYMYFIMEKNV